MTKKFEKIDLLGVYHGISEVFLRDDLNRMRPYMKKQHQHSLECYGMPEIMYLRLESLQADFTAGETFDADGFSQVADNLFRESFVPSFELLQELHKGNHFNSTIDKV